MALFVTLGYLSAQKTFNPRFELFPLPGGESASNVDCIAQDATGFVWFGSQAGLHRYDGQQVVTFHHDRRDSTSIASDQVVWICIDHTGILWLGHWGQGVSAFDPVKEKCIAHYKFDPKHPGGLSGGIVPMIAEDREGYLWIATSGGVDRLDPQRTQFTHFRHNDADANSLSYNYVNAVYIDKNGTVWIGCGSIFDPDDIQHHNGGLNRYNPDHHNFTRYLHQPHDPQSLGDNRVRTIFEDSKGNFWIGTGGVGLHKMDRTAGRFTRFPFDPAHPGCLQSPVLQRNVSHAPANYHISFIHEDSKGRLWIGAMEGGLNVYDPSTGVSRHFEVAKGVKDSLQWPTVWQFCETHDGTIWLSCGSGGWSVYRVKADKDLFPFYSVRDLGFEHLGICGALKDATGALWLQTLGDFIGLLRLDPADRHKYKSFPYKPAVPNKEFLDFFELSTDPHGNIHASTEKGLYQLDAKDTNKAGAFFHPNPIFSGLNLGKHPWPPLYDQQGGAWVATWENGVYRWSADGTKFVHFCRDTANPNSIGGDQVTAVFEDSRHNLWVTGGSVAIDESHPLFFDRFEPDAKGESGIFKHFVPPGEMGCPTRPVEDKKGNFWIATFPYGVRKINPNTGEYRTFTVANGALPTNTISDVVLGNDGNIWMLCNNKIIAIDPETEISFTYTSYHGAQTHTFSWVTGVYAAPDGEIIFGGQGGFHAFYPEEVHRLARQIPPRLCITGLTVNKERITPDKDHILTEPIWKTTAITLKHDQNVFSFQLTGFDFNNPELVRLEYMLEGYDKSWRNDLRNGEAVYINVTPGHYTFKLRGTNSLGAWGEERSLKVVVLPPWWQTWWAYFFYTAAAFCLMVPLYRYQLRRRLEHAETLRLRELDTIKTRLYTNITHEFRTPLTVILGMAQQVLDNPRDYFRHGLDMIQRNGRQLLDLVNQMLDLSKLESGRLALHYRHGDVIQFLKYLLESFHSLAEQKNIATHFHTDVDIFLMDFDTERLQQVVSNLLSNAIKFTPEEGQIYFSVHRKKTLNALPANELIIKVRDSGPGIPTAQLPRIFERFYQADDSHTRQSEGTGIGLALTRELVKLMAGNIEVTSPPAGNASGTEFTVTLPAHQTAGLEPAVWEELGRQSHKTSPPLVFDAPETHPELPLLLLAEDNPDVVEYLRVCLADTYRLATAGDGQEAADLAFHLIPDLIVADVMMPHKDGFELCALLKKDERTSHIPVVLLTAKADRHSRLEGLECGADAYLTKPFEKEELLVHIKKLLELRRQLQAHYRSVTGLGAAPANGQNAPATNNTENAFLKKARAAVEAHIDEPEFEVAQFCRALNMSHSQAHRKLSALTGYSIIRFIRFIRLNRAKELLCNSDDNISEIAFDCGFTDAAYFGKIFRHAFGLSPGEWRRQHQNP